MATAKTAWGMEVGNYAIKAIRLEREGDRVSVSDFAVIPHKKVLTTPDLDRNEMIRLGLGQFISRKTLEGEHLVMSVPGHSAFARFAKLPPVEPKKVPDIVKFEAVQQIPFPIDQVEWDYQTFHAEDSPEIEVGIFAITRERVQERLVIYGDVGITPEALTLSPVALYNAMYYDMIREGDMSGPVIFLDIGTQATDVVIAEGERCWIRTFPLGGTHFTEAIANAFKLSYTKAEKLKHEAATSKYAKQIMQAMRPVFSDLLQDLQRSIGYYSSLHGDVELKTMVGVGSTFKIPGLRKFIGQQLQINVVRLDEYRRISVTGREAASFAEHAVNMASAYGLALQGVGLAQISANLVPVKALRDQMWHSKTKWFAAAAAIAVAGAAMTLYRPLTDRAKLEAGGVPSIVSQVISQGNQLKSRYEQARTNSDVGALSSNMVRLLDYRAVWPHLLDDAAEALAAANPQPELLGTSPDAAGAVPPPQRRLIELKRLEGQYIPGPDRSRRIFVTMDVEFSHAGQLQFLNDSVASWLRQNAEPTDDRPYRIIPESVDLNPGLLQTYEVDESGLASLRDAGTGGGGRPTRPRGGGFQPPRSPTPPSGGSGGMSSGGGGGMGGMGMGGGGEMRRRPTEKRQAPGGGIGGGMGTGGGGGAPSGGGGMTPGDRPPIGGSGGSGGYRPPSGSGQTQPSEFNIAERAPIPPAPQYHPAGTKLYRVPITFEVEILEPKRTIEPSRTAAAGGEGDNA